MDQYGRRYASGHAVPRIYPWPVDELDYGLANLNGPPASPAMAVVGSWGYHEAAYVRLKVPGGVHWQSR